MADDDLTASLLTPSQREFLRGSSNLSDRGERAARSRIKRRLKAGMEDFTILLDHRERVPEYEGNPIDALALLLGRGLMEPETGGEETLEAPMPGKQMTSGDRLAWTEFLLGKALERAAEAFDHPRRYEVEIIPIENDPRSVNEFVQAVRAGELSQDDIAELYREGAISQTKFLKITEAAGDEE
ncbi:hypothetical protein ACFQPA_06840 [Halomarina halobia]|uniref:Domain of unknown function domain-containing protein n=1 Tax=Halomarina halobia TaxID=3033386 RepID=A0ABD6A7M4_9EURY|nr:hypothetical protein [Halomarina sp. PSR21]